LVQTPQHLRIAVRVRKNPIHEIRSGQMQAALWNNGAMFEKALGGIAKQLGDSGVLDFNVGYQRTPASCRPAVPSCQQR